VVPASQLRLRAQRSEVVQRVSEEAAVVAPTWQPVAVQAAPAWQLAAVVAAPAWQPAAAVAPWRAWEQRVRTTVVQ